jgi:hypothetical protein
MTCDLISMPTAQINRINKSFFITSWFLKAGASAMNAPAVIEFVI